MKSIATEVSEELGLCLTCSHRATCTTLQSYKGKIFHCEEFDVVETQMHAPKTEVETEANAYPYSSLQGLCMNCDMARTCTLPKAAAGVWHCNEYR